MRHAPSAYCCTLGSIICHGCSQVIGRLKGRELEGRGYQPILPYYEHLKGKGAFRVVCDGYVTATGGTGVVHQAPAFGEDDYRVALANGARRVLDHTSS